MSGLYGGAGLKEPTAALGTRVFPTVWGIFVTARRVVPSFREQGADLTRWRGTSPWHDGCQGESQGKAMDELTKSDAAIQLDSCAPFERIVVKTHASEYEVTVLSAQRAKF